MNPQLHNAADVRALVMQAEARIRPHLNETLLEHSLALSQDCGAEVFLKCENLQHTGSFKARGAMNKLLTLAPQDWERGVVTASTGNHGAAVAWALRKLGRAGIVFVPETVSSVKLAAIRRYGAEIQKHGADGGQTELHARRYAEERGAIYVSPYNDPQVVAGQGTCGLELERDFEALRTSLDAVFVAVGGGGLIAGIAGCLKAIAPNTRIIGCLPENSPDMAVETHPESFKPTAKPTLSDGTAGAVEAGAITIELCRNLVDKYVLVNEAEIAAEMRFALEAHHMLIEGSAGVAIAGFRKLHARFRGQNVAIVICGGNVSLSTLKRILHD